MIFSLALVLVADALVQPKADAVCYASPAHLATDNIPWNSNNPSTSIINIWAYVTRNGEPVAWVYKSSSHYQLQLNYRHAAIAKTALHFPKFEPLFAQGKIEENMAPMTIDRSILAEVDGLFRKVGVKESKCFVKDFAPKE